MALRLTHILVLMALLLAAGVLSVRHIEGATAVQGTLLIAVPGLTPEAAGRLEREGGDLRWTVMPAGGGPLAPFDDALVAERISRGTVAALFIQPPQPDLPLEAWRETWRVLIAPPTGDVLGSLADFVRGQTGTRPFLAGLILPAAADPPALRELLAPLLEASAGLPSFRHTTIVLLGERESVSGRRVVARLDRGRGAQPASATLLDLLEDDP